MRIPTPTLIVTMALCVATAWGQQSGQAPHIGYLYPAGGQRGTTVQIHAGGQHLRGATGVHVSGDGVHASVIEFIPPLWGNKLGTVGKHLRLLLRQHWAELTARRKGEELDTDKFDAQRKALPELPDHPLARDLEQKSLRELLQLRDMIFDPKKQKNSQIAESVLIEVTIDPDAAPGDRELRLLTRRGLTPPMIFQVGLLPETCEQEPNEPSLALSGRLTERQEPPLELPVLLNGQITPGDVDRFRFVAQQGQRLVIQVHARHLIPYLADAVPGWFQATVALYDSTGRELAYADDYHFNPDPVLFYEVPEDGEYQVEIRDAIYRGREDFVYRVSMGEQPFITWMFPLGGQAGVETAVSVGGWNLPQHQVNLDTQPDAGSIREVEWRCQQGICNRVLYAVDTLPEYTETEPNDTTENAEQVALPQIVNGRIATAGDTDVFQFRGHGGDKIVAEVYGRRLDSPIDSLLRLTDVSGNVLEWNDDHMEKSGHLHMGPGLLTHHADSYLMMQLPKDGVYYVQVSDAQGHGGDAWAYRLHITPPQPDFALRVVPSSLAVPAGASVPVCVYALRRDGFGGDIEVNLKDAPPGFVLQGGLIPAGHDCVRMTVTAARKPLEQPVSLHLEGRAVIAGEIVTREAVPAEDMMQAFLWRHLVPSQDLTVLVTAAGRLMPRLEVACDLPLQIPVGGVAELPVRAVGRAIPPNVHVHLALSDPPDGIALQEVTQGPDGFGVVLQADDSALEVGYADNLLIEVSAEIERKREDGTTKKWRASLGVLPAIPFEIAAP